jgi:hypothetical protein
MRHQIVVLVYFTRRYTVPRATRVAFWLYSEGSGRIMQPFVHRWGLVHNVREEGKVLKCAASTRSIYFFYQVQNLDFQYVL